MDNTFKDATFKQGKNNYGDIVTEIKSKRFEHIKDLKYRSNYWLKKRKDKEKSDLIDEINKLIDDFNNLNDEFGICLADSRPDNPYSQQKIADETLKKYKLEIHRTYLMGFFLQENLKNDPAWIQRLEYIRSKEFEKFLSSLEGKKPDVILREIQKLRKSKFDSWKQDVKHAIEYSYDFTVKQTIDKYLKSKQKSRQKQLLEKFKSWKKKLSNSNDEKQKSFLGVVENLVAIFSGNGKDLNPKELKILEECFSGYRNWRTAYSGPMVKKYNPFIRLSNKTNRVVIALYGMITDNDGKSIDPMIKKYLGMQ